MRTRTDKAGIVTNAQVREIAETKMPDLNAIDLDGAIAQVAGTARSMGIEINRPILRFTPGRGPRGRIRVRSRETGDEAEPWPDGRDGEAESTNRTGAKQ